MTTLTATTEDRATAATVRARPDVRPIPMSRVIGVELRKMFDTRSGFWLMASIGILAVLATGRDHRCSRPRTAQTYEAFASRDRLPDGRHPADDRDPLGHQRVEPAQRAHDVHAGARAAAG